MPEGKIPEEDALLLQPDLAHTLALIAAQGPRAFYRGDIAQEIARAYAESRWITKRDLAQYAPRVVEPVCGSYKGHEVCGMPPPSSGGVLLLEMLGAVEKLGGPGGPAGSPARVHRLVEVMCRAYADRATLLGDPAFHKYRWKRLASPERIAEIAASIDPLAATPSATLTSAPPPPKGGNHTSHLSVVDAWGNAVALTQSINTRFGSAFVAGSTGVLMNNEMDDFSVKPGTPNAYGLVGSEANAVAAGKAPLSSMSPTLVFDRTGRLRMAVGAPGGSTIITTVLQAILSTLDDGLSLQAALSARRIHHQWLPDLVFHENAALTAEEQAALKALGHGLKVREDWGNAQGVEVLDVGMLATASDPRGVGTGAVCERPGPLVPESREEEEMKPTGLGPGTGADE